MVLFSFGEAIQTLLDGTPAFCLKKTDDPELIVNKRIIQNQYTLFPEIWIHILQKFAQYYFHSFKQL